MGNESTCSTDNYGGTPLSEYETQAIIAAWQQIRTHPNGWMYTNLHQGASTKNGGGARSTEVETRRAAIFTELFGGSKTWTISTGGNGSNAAGEAVQYYGADSGFMLEIQSSWSRSTATLASLKTGTIHRELLSLLAAQAELVEVSDGAVTHILTIDSDPSGVPFSLESV